MSIFDVKKVKEEAEKEVRDEVVIKAKERIKQKLRQLDSAKTVLANIEREIEDLYVSISQGN